MKQKIILFIIMILLLDKVFHAYITKIINIKHQLIFNWYNYPLINLIHLMIIQKINYTKDKKNLLKLYLINYQNKFKKLLSNESFNKMSKNINNYISNICNLHYSKLSSIYCYSMLDITSLDNIENSCKYIMINNIEGDFVECGVWRGGTAILIKSYLNKINNKNRKVYLLDSFEGMEDIANDKNTFELDYLCSNLLNDCAKYFGKPIIETNTKEVINNLKRFNCYDNNTILLKGWFNEKFPFDKINKISLLRLDCDYYYPTKICLEKLYDKVSVGGIIILDEYYLDFMGERYAVDEFRKNNNITSKIIKVNNNVAFWIK